MLKQSARRDVIYTRKKPATAFTSDDHQKVGKAEMRKTMAATCRRNSHSKNISSASLRSGTFPGQTVLKGHSIEYEYV